MPCSRYTRSSVAMLPVARGAKGQPPVPPTEESSTVAPASMAAAALAMPVLRVSWKWHPTVVPNPRARLDGIRISITLSVAFGDPFEEHLSRLHVSLEGVAEGYAQGDGDTYPVETRP